MSEKTVIVKGTVYDKRTGMPLRLDRASQQTKTAHSVHRPLQKSQTLNRKYVKRDVPQVASAAIVTPAPEVLPTITTHHVTRTPRVVKPAPKVTHFAKPVAKPHTGKVMSDIGPAPHRLATQAQQKIAKPFPQTIVKPSQIIKQEAIAKAMANTPAKRDHQVTPPSRHPKLKRHLSMASVSLAILLLGGYLTYLSMPSISTRVAASQAGIAASYPSYQPTGYSLNGPVAYQQGRVTMTFAANAGPMSYTLDQTKSGWDSSAVLDSYVKPKAGDDYQTTTSNGLTIYSFGSTAAWVNRGIFYTISGDAPLSEDQIQRIATSL
jgi:hypothetical protein